MKKNIPAEEKTEEEKNMVSQELALKMADWYLRRKQKVKKLTNKRLSSGLCACKPSEAQGEKEYRLRSNRDFNMHLKKGRCWGTLTGIDYHE